MGPVATCETLGSEWEQSVADGMNRSQDKHPCLAWPIRRSSCRNGFAVVAQLAEQRPRNAQVTGPNPVDGSMTQSILDGISLVGAKERNRYGKHQPQTYRSYP